MSNWSLPGASRLTTLGVGTGEGVAVVASATANIKGAYVTIGTVPFDCHGIVLQLVAANSGRFRIDLALNTGGSDQVIVEDFFLDSFTVANMPLAVRLPIEVPAGAVIKARCQGSVGSIGLRVLVTGYAVDTPAFVRARALRCLTNWAGGETPSVLQAGTSQTAWTELMPATPELCAELTFMVSTGGDNTRTGGRMVIEIGIGPAGAEVPLLTIQAAQAGAGVGIGLIGPFPCMVPAGARLAFRVQCSAAGMADTVGLAAFGLTP